MQRAPRLAVMTLPTLDHFTADILALLPAATGWDIRKFMVTGPNVLPAALSWTDRPSEDAIWFEFCWPPFPELIGSTDFGGRRVLVRVHRIEATETTHVADTAWANVSDVIVVSADMRDRVVSSAPEIPHTARLHLVPNGVDVGRFGLTGTWNKFQIGWCGLMTLRKNPSLALQILLKLRALDPRYHLRLCGMGGEPLANETFWHLVDRLDLQDAIRWEGSVSQADMPSWHQANGTLLHTSLHESFGYAVAEAALCGCDIVVADHPGAATTWPGEVLFGSIEQATSKILDAKPHRWRNFVIKNFSLETQINNLAQLLKTSGQVAASTALS